MVKGKLTTHYCVNKKCGWEETSHRLLDGIRCPKCRGIVISYPTNRTVTLDEIHDYPEKILK